MTTQEERDLTAEARHGGRYITGALARVVGENPTHYHAVLTDPEKASGLWHFALSPSGGTGSGRDSTARSARNDARLGGVSWESSAYWQAPLLPEAAFDWPIYRAAVACAPRGDGTLGPSMDVSRTVKDHINDLIDGYPIEFDELMGERFPQGY